MVEERDRRDNITRYPKNHYGGKRKDVPVRRDDVDTCPEEPSFQKPMGNIKAFIPSFLKAQSVPYRGRSISRERKSSNFERSPMVLCDLIKKDKVLSSEVRAMCSKNPKPSSKFIISASSEESSSSDRTMDDSVIIGIETADNPSVSSGRGVGLHARDETWQFVKYPENVDVAKKFLQYKKSLDEEWGDYVINAGLWFRTLVRPSGNVEHYQVAYGLSIPLTFYQKRVMNALMSYPGQLNGNTFEMMRVCEVLNQKLRDGGIARLFVADDVLKYYKFKYMKDWKSGYLFSDSAMPKFFDFESFGRPWCDHVVMVRGIRREKRLNSVVKKMQRAHQKRVMAASGSSYADVMEIPACVMGTLSSLLSVAWKLAAEVLKLAVANRAELVWQHDVEKAVLQEQFEQKKMMQREQFEKEKVMRGSSSRRKLSLQSKRADVDLALAGKYGEIVFPGDDASPVAEQTLAPPVDNDPTKEEVVHLRGKVIEMEKALSRARDSINRTRQGQRAMRILFFNIKTEDRKINIQFENDLRHACDELERCKGHNICLEVENVECARLLQNSEKRVTLLEARLLDTQ
ncbi:hypothetical protein GIB67_001918 [Kingdonia uniflora]|uniref:Uncharacterized protein n=1 Tax=Kingdonia uniflora TaxID=39325 RepID=A0A7J7NVT5_9MAGN|nr:hypothetical protein GIB67_001918 [Kingdonia uniflora]